MEESQKQLEEMKKALSDNDTHIQLSNLERRWQVTILNTLFVVIQNIIMSVTAVEMLKRIIIILWLISTQYQEQLS